MNSEIAGFAEEHFDDKNADRAWGKLLKARKIETRCQELLEMCEARSNDKLKEVSREITNELKFATSFAGDKSLRMHKIINGKRLWDWTAVIAGGGLSIAWGIATLIGAAVAGPLGWAALAVSGIGFLGSYLFKSREKKEYEARLKLEKNLRNNVNKICDTLQIQMEKNLNTLASVRIDGLLKEIDKINRPLENSIAVIDGNIQEIRDTRDNRSASCRSLEKLQRECRFLIQDIHAENI